MDYSPLTLYDIVPRKSKTLWIVLIITGVLQLILVLAAYFGLINIPPNLAFIISVLLVPPAVFMSSAVILLNERHFKKSGNQILLKQDRITFVFKNNSMDVLLHDIVRIDLTWNGVDEGPLNALLGFSFSRYVPQFKQGNFNYIQFDYKNGKSQKFEFYCKTERDSIKLKNFLWLYEDKGIAYTVRKTDKY